MYCVTAMLCYGSTGGVRVKRSVKMSQSLPASGQSLPARNALNELGFGETKSPDKEEKAAEKSKKGNSHTRMSLKKSHVKPSHSNKKKQEKGEEEEEEEEEQQQQQNSNSQAVQEAPVVGALQRQVQLLQADLATRAEQQTRVEEQLRRRELEWQRVSRQVEWLGCCAVLYCSASTE